jgi:GR25 family glycosyltransferase involved in LPS biosynthesis
MDKNIDRLENIKNLFNKYNLSFTRVKAINGSDMENDDDAQKLLQPRKKLMGAIFRSVDNTQEKWVYDGTVHKSFPNLNLFGHHGTKGLTLSNIKAFYITLHYNFNWFCILEDDTEITEDAINKINNFVNNPHNNKYDIVLLDNRANGWGGTCAMLYNKRIIKKLILDLHPLSYFSIMSTKVGDKNLSNLWDWKLWKYVKHVNKNYTTLPCVLSGNFGTTIN